MSMIYQHLLVAIVIIHQPVGVKTGRHCVMLTRVRRRVCQYVIRMQVLVRCASLRSWLRS